MKLISIFVNNETKEGLYAVAYEDENDDEFNRLLNLWTDPNYLLEYLQANEVYLQAEFFKGYSIADLTVKISREVSDLDDMFLDFEEQFLQDNTKLQMLFRPLFDGEYVIPMHQATKTSIRNWKSGKALLRFYAVRIGANTFVITGGAIKLVRQMKDHPDTQKELDKLKVVKKFLLSKGLESDEDLIFIL